MADRKGRHERLDEISTEVWSIVHNELAHYTAPTTPGEREEIRAWARRILVLMNEHENLDTPLREKKP